MTDSYLCDPQKDDVYIYIHLGQLYDKVVNVVLVIFIQDWEDTINFPSWKPSTTILKPREQDKSPPPQPDVVKLKLKLSLLATLIV